MRLLRHQNAPLLIVALLFLTHAACRPQLGFSDTIYEFARGQFDSNRPMRIWCQLEERSCSRSNSWHDNTKACGNEVYHDTTANVKTKIGLAFKTKTVDKQRQAHWILARIRNRVALMAQFGNCCRVGKATPGGVKQLMGACWEFIGPALPNGKRRGKVPFKIERQPDGRDYLPGGTKAAYDAWKNGPNGPNGPH